MPRLTARARTRALAGLYAALGVANSASVAKRFRAGEWATKPLLMPVLAAFTLVAAGDREEDMRLPAAGIALSGLGDLALLGSESWFVPGMGAFAAAHACYVTALVAVMPTYIAAQFLLAAGFLRPQGRREGHHGPVRNEIT